MMELLEQCQKWHENDEYQKIIDALEVVPEEERTPEMDSELARAYNNLADPETEAGRQMLRRAIDLLAPHQEYFAGDHCWNFRMGYSWYYLDQEGRALPYFREALKARPGDEDTQELIDDCQSRISLPRFGECFRERTVKAWKSFSQQEEKLRHIMDEDKNHDRGEELIRQCEKILNLAFDDVCFEMGFNGEKHELILTPEGDKVKLFELVYFQKHAPEEVLKHWNILVGRQPAENTGLRIEEWEISGDEVQVWVEQLKEEGFALSVCCEKLLPLLREEEGRAWWMLTTLTDQVLGEIPHMRYIDSFDVLETPREEPPILLSELPDRLRDMGLELSTDPDAYLESYIGYQMEPDQDPEADWRLDVIAGSTCCAALINDYMSSDNDFMDDLHADGAAAGFLCYPLDTLREAEGSQKIFDFRDKLEEYLSSACGPDVLTLVGGATGLFCGYVDFIAWDLDAVLRTAREFFADTDLPWASFHTFRREAGTVGLKRPEDEGTQAGEPERGQDDEEQEEKAIPYARRWAELDPEDEDAQAVIRECQEEIAKRRRRASRKKKVRFVPGDIPFEGFDLTNFWDDNAYALKEYVSDPPTDELIADVEKELGYKLPASYIWLMKQHNGGMPVNTCYPTDESTSWAEDHVAITGIFGIGRGKAYSLCGELGSQFMIDEWEYPAIGVAVCDCPSAGHDMIFLDYRACGPQGEPAVVHVDQENDYKITHLADSFEEFIRGLENESVYELDEDAYDGEDADEADEGDTDEADEDAYDGEDEADKDAYDGEEEGEFDHKGTFAGFVLLSRGKWDKAQFIRDMKEMWDVTVEEDENEDKRDDAAVFDVGDMIAAVSLMPYPIPGGEAEMNAENNYLWPDAVKAARKHRAHIMVAVLGKEEDVLEKGKLYTKLAAACCRQKYAAGVYTSGVVFEPRFYEGFADMMKEDELPIFNWIWFGLYRSEGGMNAYTYGMDVFGKDEMEVLDADAEPGELRDFLASLVSYVLENDVELHEGETIGFAADDKHSITRSPGVGLPEEQMTLKISWESSDGDPEDGGDGDWDGGEDGEDDDWNGGEDGEDDYVTEMDDGAWHLETIREKGLAVDELSAYNHMAIYLRWCMEHDLMGQEFLEEYGEVVRKVKDNAASVDLREFLRDELEGQLVGPLFNKKGRAFASYYYGEMDSPYFPSDIDNYAIGIIGQERNYSDEIQDEAYLFLPFDEDYYQAMAKVIEKRFVNWQGQDFDEDTLEPSKLARAIMEYLDCECTYFPAMKDDDPIMSAYSYAKRDSAHEGFVPVLINADETLWECLIMNSDPDSDGEEDYAFDPDKVAEYREKMLAAPIKDGKAVLEELIGQRRAEAEDDDMDWEEEILGGMEEDDEPDTEDELNCRFASYWREATKMTCPLILARIPVKNPWEIFAYLPFGGWNECPDTPELMAAAKYWFEQYGAAPAAMTHDVLEFELPAPVSADRAMELATEQYGFCPDVIDQGPEDATVGALADILRQSSVWYFWWD